VSVLFMIQHEHRHG